MYLGEIVEIIESQDIVKEAKHSYTKMLISSIFSVKNYNKKIKVAEVKLKDLENTKGCVFAPRCPNKSEKCYEEKCTLRKISEYSSVACSLY